MSKYTTELRFVCNLYTRSEVESWFKDYDLSDFLTEEQINVIINTKIWDKDRLAKKIVDHYYMREIGFETPALFRHYAKITMYEIMEKYVPLIYSSSIIYDPLVNVDYTETFNRNVKNKNVNKGSSSSTSTANGTGLQVGSDTPQGQVNKNEILQGKYASETTANESSTNSTDTVNSTSNDDRNTDEEYTKNVKGNSGVSATAQKMIEQYRKNIITIDTNIIKELNILFMGLY